MAVLKNPKHERYCQERIKGKGQGEAYELAGYKPDDGAASRLSRNVKIIARMAELQERAANRVEVSVASVTESLLRIAQKAEHIGEPAGLNVAKSAWMDVAKVNGLIIDKKETGKPGDFDRMTEDELEIFIKGRIAGAGNGDAGSGSEAGQTGVRTKPSGLH